jgi:hypothetical protein
LIASNLEARKARERERERCGVARVTDRVHATQPLVSHAPCIFGYIYMHIYLQVNVDRVQYFTGRQLVGFGTKPRYGVVVSPGRAGERRGETSKGRG